MSFHRLHLNVTARCNLGCHHCYWPEHGANHEPSLDEIDTILLRFSAFCCSRHEIGTHSLTLGGGEPTLRDDLERIIGLAIRRGYRVRLVTNGTLIDEPRARSLRRAGLLAVQVGVDAACEATYERVRGAGGWRRMIAGVQALKQAHAFVILSFVLLPGINDVESHRLLDLVRHLGVAGAKFARPVCAGQALAAGLVCEGDHWSTFRAILEHAQAIRYRRLLLVLDPLAHHLRTDRRHLTVSLPGLSTDLCQCNNTATVEIDGGTGAIYYCRVRTVLGNIWRDDLASVWRAHPLLAAVRRRTAVGACDGCPAWTGCRGGCPALACWTPDMAMLQDTACPKVRMQSRRLEFPETEYSNARQLTPYESLQRAGRRFRDLVYSMALR